MENPIKLDDLGVPLFLETPIYIGCGPLPVTVTTRIITFLVGDPYKPSFPTVTGGTWHPRIKRKTRCHRTFQNRPTRGTIPFVH